MRGFQYDEMAILKGIFPCLGIPKPYPNGLVYMPPGYMVEIGAADGIDNSNSFDLIKDHNWRALLVEPHPGFFMDLLKLYSDEPRVTLSNYAISSSVSRRKLGIDGQCSSLVYNKPISIEVQCITLNDLFELYKVPAEFEFLSIDCEGEDMAVLKSLNWNRYNIKAVCVEHSMPMVELVGYMESVGYVKLASNMGNTFFIKP